MSLDIKKDFFNIYKGIAIEAKEITNNNVTRDQITFHMYRNNFNPKGVILDDTNLSLLEGTNGYIVFILHGWTDNDESDWVHDLKDAFLNIYPNAVVNTVDWREPANQIYVISSINVYDVGNFVADMILNLIDKHGINISQFILIGHSLGGQSCGFVGKKLQKLGIKLPRIIALDPAGPLFDVRPHDKRLNSTDAEVVEVIHTDAGNFGFKDSCGTIDFFPNGGDFQPGCTRVDLLDISSVTDPVVCDHRRSYYYFIEAIQNPTHLVATLCTEWTVLRKICNYNITVPMGDLSTTLTGNFYLETNKERPYNKRVITENLGLLDRAGKLLSKFNVF